MAITTCSSFADLTKKLKARALDIKSRVESMRGKRVVVGIPASAEYPNGKKVAAVAQLINDGVHENGYPMRAGPRRFFTVAADNNGKKWSRILQDGVRKALRARQRPNMRPVMIKVGEAMVDDIRKTMLDMDVYDTGRMYSSISILNINGQKVDKT